MSDLEKKLRAMADLPVPPSQTALDDVLRRGRRRVYALRAGAVAGVVAVVAGAGFTALALRVSPTSLPPAGDGPALTSTPNQPRTWSAVDLPAQVPYDTWRPAETAPPGADRKVLTIPLCSSHWDEQVAELRTRPLSSAVAEEFGRETGMVDGLAVVSEQKTVILRSAKPNGAPVYMRWVDVTDVGGTGSLTISDGRYAGTPLAAADREAFLPGNCEPPKRLVLDDGTVVQCYSVVPSEPFQSLHQALRIYYPSGVVVEIEQRNFGSPDFRVNDEGTAFDRTGRGRETLPLSEERLEGIGEAVAYAD